MSSIYTRRNSEILNIYLVCMLDNLFLAIILDVIPKKMNNYLVSMLDNLFLAHILDVIP